MKIWCICKGDTAKKWRELLVVEQPSPVACVAHNIFWEAPVNLDSGVLTAHRLPLNIFTGYLPHLMAVQDMKGTNLLEKNR
jgi:hypothetical protein